MGAVAAIARTRLSDGVIRDLACISATRVCRRCGARHGLNAIRVHSGGCWTGGLSSHETTDSQDVLPRLRGIGEQKSLEARKRQIFTLKQCRDVGV